MKSFESRSQIAVQWHTEMPMTLCAKTPVLSLVAVDQKNNNDIRFNSEVTLH